MNVSINYVPMSSLELPDEDFVSDFADDNDISWDGENPVLYPSAEVIEALKLWKNEVEKGPNCTDDDFRDIQMINDALAKLEQVEYVSF